MTDENKPRITIHTVVNPPPPSNRFHPFIMEAAQLVEAHRRGDHTYGNMRRECPLCR
jgi:hypothetical protein